MVSGHAGQLVVSVALMVSRALTFPSSSFVREVQVRERRKEDIN